MTNRGTAEPLEITIESGELVVELPDGTTVPRGASVQLLVSQDDAPQRGASLSGAVNVSNGGLLFFGEAANIPWTARRYELGVVGVGSWIVEVRGDVLPYRKTVVVEAGQTAVCRMTLDDVP